MLNRSRDVTEYGSGLPEARMRTSLPEQKREAGAEALIQDFDPGYGSARRGVNPIRCSFFQVLEQRIGLLAP
jgi:hypothetical protein